MGRNLSCAVVLISKHHIVQHITVIGKQVDDWNISKVEPLQQHFALLRIWIYSIPKVPGTLFKVNRTGLSTLQYQTPDWFQSQRKSKTKKPPTSQNTIKKPTELQSPPSKIILKKIKISKRKPFTNLADCFKVLWQSSLALRCLLHPLNYSQKRKRNHVFS